MIAVSIRQWGMRSGKREIHADKGGEPLKQGTDSLWYLKMRKDKIPFGEITSLTFMSLMQFASWKCMDDLTHRIQLGWQVPMPFALKDAPGLVSSAVYHCE